MKTRDNEKSDIDAAAPEKDNDQAKSKVPEAKPRDKAAIAAVIAAIMALLLIGALVWINLGQQQGADKGMPTGSFDEGHRAAPAAGETSTKNPAATDALESEDVAADGAPVESDIAIQPRSN